MKWSLSFLLLLVPAMVIAQDGAYVKALYKKFPTQKSDLCPSCLLWVNPFYRSIGDTVRHAPVLTYLVYTKTHRLEQESLGLPRTGVYGRWHPAFGQPDESAVYKQANKVIGKPNSPEMIAKGHCQAWILLAWNGDAAILSDTYTFNAAMEFQGQNVGTQIATEEFCRQLTGFRAEAVTDSVRIWCGTFGSARTFRQGDLSVTVPTHYYKVIEFYDRRIGGTVLLTYWLPNVPTERRDMLADRLIMYSELVSKLGFDPRQIFH
jgi:hypothetical protein